MNMTTADIVHEYQQAKNKRNQVTVLADMNQCSKDKILDVLASAGCNIDKRWYSSNRRRKEMQPMNKEVELIKEPTGRVITEEQAVALAAFLEEAVPQYVLNSSLTDPKEVMVKIHTLTGIYMTLIS